MLQPAHVDRRQGKLETLHPTARKVYDAIVAHKRDNDGCAPTIRQIQEACHIASTSGVVHHLDRLALLGLIESDFGARNIRVVGGHWTLS